MNDRSPAALWCDMLSLSVSLPFDLHALTWRESRTLDGRLAVAVLFNDGRVIQATVEFPPTIPVAWYAARRCLKAEIVAQAREVS